MTTISTDALAGDTGRNARLQPLPHVDLLHEPRQKVLAHHRETAILRCETVCCVQWLLYQRTLTSGNPSHVYVCTALKHFMRMSNGTPEVAHGVV